MHSLWYLHHAWRHVSENVYLLFLLNLFRKYLCVSQQHAFISSLNLCYKYNARVTITALTFSVLDKIHIHLKFCNKMLMINLMICCVRPWRQTMYFLLCFVKCLHENQFYVSFCPYWLYTKTFLSKPYNFLIFRDFTRLSTAHQNFKRHANF